MSLLRHALVGLDGSPASESALLTTLHLLQPGLGRVTGCYVEDASLRRAAQLDITRTVQAGRSTAVPLSTRDVEHSFQESSDYVRWRLHKFAQAYNVDAEVQTVEGHTASALMEETQSCDLLSIGVDGRTRPTKNQLGSTPQRLIHETSHPLLIAPHVVRGLNHVTVYFTEGPDAAAALQWATYAAYALHANRVRVLIPASDDATYAQQRDALRATRPAADILWHPSRCSPMAVQRPGTALHRPLDGLVIAPMAFAREGISALGCFLYELQQPLLLACTAPTPQGPPMLQF